MTSATTKRASRRAARAAEPEHEDTALRSLSEQERARLEMDSWEPSLLRALLAAQNKIPTNKKS